jgi:hypothetical protein
MIKIEISRMLCGYGYRPFFARGLNNTRIKQSYEKFSTLKELKEYYGIKKLIKTDRKDWAISSTGKKYEFTIYEAEISDSYLV